jgi:tRNA-dihydrouridine synthase 2
MLDYSAKFVLAPMVRIGELPTRLLALKYGADLVWGPEIIDKKIITCERLYNDKLKTVDFLSKTGNKKIPGMTDLVFRTFPELENDKIVFQMGTANPELAVEAAKIIINDVSAIDINAGCPKHFSIHSGMGAALLSTPDLLCDILTNLVNEVGKPNNKPISVKIRLLPKKEDTLILVNRLVRTGITNLTVHCRTREMRNRENPIRDYLDEIKQICIDNKVSFIINGMVKNYKDYKDLQEKFGNDVGAMIASAAEINPTCFNKDGPLPWYNTVKEYIRFVDQFNNHPANTKYCITRMIPNERNENKIYGLITKAKEAQKISDIILNMMDDNGNYIEQNLNKLKDSDKIQPKDSVEISDGTQKRKGDNVETPIEKKIKV